jgi:hypothetical protein
VEKTYTKAELLEKLISIANQGWVRNARPGNDGGVGNTLEDMLGIKENNLPIANAAEWELKCQRSKTSSLTTLFHFDPSPRALTIVTALLLPHYGWRHKQAGGKYPLDEMSFRQTLNGVSRSDRGFGVAVDRNNRKIVISFNASSVSERHKGWLADVERRVGLSELNPQPYWGFDDLYHKAGTKLLNCLYIRASSKKEKGVEYFKYENIQVLETFSLENFITAIETGEVLVDFDARTRHNHGTKFRLRKDKLPLLYAKVAQLL